MKPRKIKSEGIKSGAPDDGQAPEGDARERYIVLFREGAEKEAVSALEGAGGYRVATTAEPGVTSEEDAPDADALVFHNINAAVIEGAPERIRSLGAGDPASPIEACEPEQEMHVLEDFEGVEAEGEDELRTALEPAYLRGYRDSVVALVNKLLAAQGLRGERAPEEFIEALDESRFTWGLQAVGAHLARESGRGVRVAVLDTGFGPHADFRGRALTSRSFVTGESPVDGHGHGTHCMGTACGPKVPGALPRYGVAHLAELFVGKVLSNAGSGSDSSILAGIDWAVANRCAVVSMSLGSAARVGDAPSPVYEGVARRALDRGTLIVAAAGNESRRSAGIFNPVARPANCPSILAVAALTAELRVADFSNRAFNANGGEVNLAAPGVNVHSSWPFAPFYRRLNGTSMATPHVAGVAALYAERTGARGRALWKLLVNNARRLPLPTVDVGAGLVQIR